MMLFCNLWFQLDKINETAGCALGHGYLESVSSLDIVATDSEKNKMVTAVVPN